MSKKRMMIYINILIVCSLVITGCTSGGSVAARNQTNIAETEVSNQEGNEIERPDGWTEETHGKSAEPNYEIVFPQEQVNRIDISIASENWQALLDNMTELFGEQGSGDMRAKGPGRQAGEGFQPPAGMVPPEGFQPGDGMPLPENGEPPQGIEPPDPGDLQNNGVGGRPGGGMGVDLVSENPDYIPATVVFNGETWNDVGFRFKGNSTLLSSWSSGSMKISFKLDFDEFEDGNPAIEDQRFYGFKQLAFNNNAQDESYLREKETADIFRDAGLSAAHTAFYAVYIDYGNGPEYFGLYTLVEVVEDTVIETQFEDDSGNVYKPEGRGATFVDGSFSEDSFEKETNQDEKDWSDIQALFEALHAETRLTDAETWRKNLESVFDVDTFLHWLAVDTIVQNWDTYGSMSHNYYLYNDPTTGLLTWIPWDNNMALSSSLGRGNPRELDLSNVEDNWPLITYLTADPIYLKIYQEYLQETIDTVFTPERMSEIYQNAHDLIQPYVTGENGEQEGYTQIRSTQAFDQSVQNLIDHVKSRYQAVEAYLASAQ